LKVIAMEQGIRGLCGKRGKIVRTLGIGVTVAERTPSTQAASRPSRINPAALREPLWLHDELEEDSQARQAARARCLVASSGDHPRLLTAAHGEHSC
jgi:hypothetical protein